MDKVYSLIGLAQKAGKVSSGTMAAKTSLIRKRARLLVVSHDISAGTLDALLKICVKNKVPGVSYGTKNELGSAVGKAYRVALTINDPNMASAVIQAIESKGEKLISMGVVEWQK